MRGLITKAIAGFYYVKSDKGIYQCRARGVLKKEGISPLVGDYVDIEVTDKEDDEGVIDEVYPRKNVFIRPPVANIDMFAVIVSLDDPVSNTEIIDKFLMTAELAQVEIIMVINKDDLRCKGSEKTEEEAEKLLSVYSPLYNTLVVSAVERTGLEQLKIILRGKKTAFTGPSGVGKSTLINSLDDRYTLETGGVSKKTGRGKHTTRHVEIYDTGFGASIYDTPGFTSFEVVRDDNVRLDFLFRDFIPYKDKCRFADCMHINEPGCAVRKAVEEEKISSSRYASYVKIGEEWYG